MIDDILSELHEEETAMIVAPASVEALKTCQMQLAEKKCLPFPKDTLIF